MSTGPLEGYRVVELGQGIPAAVAGMHLGDGGADVIKVEHTGGDIARQMPPFYDDGESGVFVGRQPQQARRRSWTSHPTDGRRRPARSDSQAPTCWSRTPT